MTDRTISVPALAAAALAFCLFVVCGVVGGAGLAPDVAIIQYFVAWRMAHSGVVGPLVAFTQLGGAPVLLSVTIVGIVAAGLRSRSLVWPLALTIIGGRLTIELIKLLVSRRRPALDAHPVNVFSQSFPSAHAGDSMLVFLALALWLSPARWRATTGTAAVLASLAIGASRPVLGVHWPTDVLGGWSFGIAWVSVFWAISRAFGRASPPD